MKAELNASKSETEGVNSRLTNFRKYNYGDVRFNFVTSCAHSHIHTSVCNGGQHQHLDTTNNDTTGKIMQKMQTGLKTAKEAEDKAKATEESLKQEIANLKQRLDEAKTAPAAVPAATTESPEVTEDAEKETPPATEETPGMETKEKPDENEKQGVEKVLQ